MQNHRFLERRSFIRQAFGLGTAIALAPAVKAAAATAAPMEMSFYHTHTGERVKIEYCTWGCAPSVLEELNQFLRDFRTGEVHPIDAGLFSTLYNIQQISGRRGDIEIISGYRSPKTNSQLRKKGGGVAKRSMHMQGKAMDIRISGLDTRQLRDIAVSLSHGGVGYYSRSNFVHIDTGRVRTW
ncbi:MAG: DUF882 domain-containing protein [Thermodesulfobacteriota bacterium]